MANPQIENGYLKIANELARELCSLNLSNADWTVLMTVFTKTYGWNKKEDAISLTQFQKITGMSRPRTARAIKRLVRYNVLGSNTGNTSTTSKYWVIKDYEKWTAPSNRAVTSNNCVTDPSNTAVTDPSNTAVTYKRQLKTIKDIGVNSSDKNLLKYFGKVFNNTLGAEYTANFKKDNSILSKLIKQHGRDRVMVLIDAFFKSEDVFIKSSGQTVGVFYSQVNKLQIKTRVKQKTALDIVFERK